MKAIHILYIPGLGDRYDPLRARLLSWWRYCGITTELVPMAWSDNISFEEKFQRLSDAIDRSAGRRIVLIGESAGGSMAVNMYAARAGDIDKVLTFCGKNMREQGVSPHLYRTNPAFRTSMSKTGHSITLLSREKRVHFTSVIPLYDPVVRIEDTLLPGCRQLRLWSFGHFVPIVQALTISSWRIVREIRR